MFFLQFALIFFHKGKVVKSPCRIHKQIAGPRYMEGYVAPAMIKLISINIKQKNKTKNLKKYVSHATSFLINGLIGR